MRRVPRQAACSCKAQATACVQRALPHPRFTAPWRGEGEDVAAPRIDQAHMSRPGDPLITRTLPARLTAAVCAASSCWTVGGGAPFAGVLKTAERMVLELRDKLAPEGVALSAVMPAMSATEEDVLSALMNLGYQRPAAERALASVEKNGKSTSFEVMFRQTLAVLSK